MGKCETKVSKIRAEKKTNIFLRILIFLLVMVLLPIIMVVIVYIIFKLIVLDNSGGANDLKDKVIDIGTKINDKKIKRLSDEQE
jgi:uncharacterized membrane protein YjgN (DUF898 family)